MEATQLKAVRTVIVVIRVDPAVIEVQEVGIGTRNRRRPTVPVAADVIQRTGAVVAVARRKKITPEALRASSRLLVRRQERFGLSLLLLPNFREESRSIRPPPDHGSTLVRV